MKKWFVLRGTAAFALVLALFLCLLPQRAHAVYVREFFDWDEEATPATEEERKENLRIIADFLRDEMGLNDAAAAAIVANISRECSFDYRAVDSGRNFFGLCQWSRTRWISFTSFCYERELDKNTLEAQLLFLQYELETDYHDLLTYVLMDAENSEDGALYAQWCFCQFFEVPTELEKEQEIRAWLVHDTYWPLLSEGELAREDAA